MSKKAKRRSQTVAPKPTPPALPLAPEAAARRGSLWKWLALLAVGVGFGVGLAAFLNDDGPPGPAPEGMVWIPRGKFRMGTDDRSPHFADAHPIHVVEIDGFWLDEAEVTNAQFATFVEATTYKTVAEQVPTVEQILLGLPVGSPPPDPASLVAGALVYTPPPGPVPLDNASNWWNWEPGACWKHPEGPGSDLKGRENHPVVHVAWRDADAYCKWAGKRLPTEAEWERTARGKLDGKMYAWGDESPGAGGKWRCNIFQGEFPWNNTAGDGHARTAPVKSYPPNAYGLHDMAGNVWEWCSDWYTPDYYASSPVKNPRGPDASYDPTRPEENPHMPKRVQRGGSFLCSDGFCSRYKPFGRGKGDIDTGQSHVGFRCAKDR